MKIEELIARFCERAKHAEKDGKTSLAQDFRAAAKIARELAQLRASQIARDAALGHLPEVSK